MKSVFSEIPPLAFNAVRMTLAALVLSAIWLAREGTPTMPLQDWLKLWGVGLLGNAVYQILFVIGLDLTTSSTSSFLIGTIPVWAALLATMLGWEKLTRRTWLGILSAFVGVTLVTLGSPVNHSRENSLVGNGLTLLAAISWAGYTVFSKDLLKRYSPLRVAAVGLLLGVPGLWPFAVAQALQVPWSTLSLTAWGSIVYTSLLPIAFAYLIWSYAIQTIGAARTAVFNNLVPIVTLALAFLLLHEPMTWLQILGGAIIVLGVWQTIQKNGADA